MKKRKIILVISLFLMMIFVGIGIISNSNNVKVKASTEYLEIGDNLKGKTINFNTTINSFEADKIFKIFFNNTKSEYIYTMDQLYINMPNNNMSCWEGTWLHNSYTFLSDQDYIITSIVYPNGGTKSDVDNLLSYALETSSNDIYTFKESGTNYIYEINDQFFGDDSMNGSLYDVMRIYLNDNEYIAYAFMINNETDTLVITNDEGAISSSTAEEIDNYFETESTSWDKLFNEIVVRREETPMKVYYLDFSYIKNLLEKFDDGIYKDKLKLEFEYGVWTKDSAYTKFSINDSLENYSPVFNGNQAYVTNYDSKITINEIIKKIVVLDNEDGVLTSKIYVESDHYSSSESPGTFEIVLSCTDSSGNKSLLTITVLVIDNVAPVISTNDETVYAKYAEGGRLTVSDVLKITNTNITDNYKLANEEKPYTIIKDTYSNNFNVPGSYEIQIKCVDTSGNSAIKSYCVVVIDDVKPIFDAPTEILKNASETLTLSDIKKLVKVNDGIDGNITNNIQLVSDEYTGHGDKKGTYKIAFSCKDSSNNETIHEITIKVIDNIPPVFYVDNYFINTSTLNTLTNEQIVSLLVASKQIVNDSSTVVRCVSNEYVGHESEVGTYEIRYKVRSASGVEDTIEVAVVVSDNENNPNENDIIVEEKTFLQQVKEFMLKDFWFGWNMWIWVLIGLFVVIILFSILGSCSSKRRYR